MADRQLAGFGIPKGKVTYLTLPVGSLAAGTPLTLPVVVFRGHEDGTCVLLTAGIHGDETNGTEIIRQLICENALMPVCGMVVAIPVVNTSGFMFRSRMMMPESKDLNRSFPGSPHGSLSGRLAHILMQEILPQVDVGIDFHTGSDRMENHPQLCCMFTHSRSKELARAFGAPFAVHTEPIDQSFRKEAQKVGKTILTYEGGESMRLDAHTIAQGKVGVKRLLAHLHLTDQPVDTSPTVWVKNSVWLRTRESGIFQPHVACGAKVRKNDLLGVIANPYGTSQFTLKSPQDGYILSLQRGGVVNMGEACIQLGK